MKQLFFINDTLENKISYFLISCFLIALPFQHFFSEILLTCFTIHTLIHIRKKNLQALKNKTVWIIAAIFFKFIYHQLQQSCRGRIQRNRSSAGNFVVSAWSFSKQFKF